MNQNQSQMNNHIQHIYAQIAKSITSSLDFSTIIGKIMEQIQLFFRPQNWSLLRVDPESSELYFVVCEGLHSEKIKHLRLKVGEGVVGKVAQMGKPLIVKNVAENSNFNNRVDEISGFSTNSLVAVPIIFQNHVLGVIELINILEHKELTDWELEVLMAIADFSAIAINNAIIHEKIVFLATHDALTKVYNRTFLNSFHDLLLERSACSHEEYAIVILVDIDYFKKINDQYGHIIGDNVLVKMAEILSSTCSKKDCVFRIGGDEFLVIMTNLNSQELDSIETNTKNKLNKFLEDNKLNFSYSFGMSSGKLVELDSIIQLADAKMYKEKRFCRKLSEY